MHIIVTLLACMPGTRGHGWIAQPKARQLYFQRGGPDGEWDVSVSDGTGRGNTDAKNALPNECGDPFGRKESEPTSYISKPQEVEPEAMYDEGQVIEVTSTIDFNHGGRIDIKVCDRRNNVDQACFDKHPLKRADVDDTGWYLLDEHRSNYGEKDYKQKFKLPDGLTCPEGCVMQWWWTSYENCILDPDCNPKACGFYADGFNKIAHNHDSGWKLKKCENKVPVGGKPPQVFVNCADISIGGKGKGERRLTSGSKSAGGKKLMSNGAETGGGAAGVGEVTREESMKRDMFQKRTLTASRGFVESGNGALDCADGGVQEAVAAINKERSSRSVDEVKCHDEETRAASYHAMMMCEAKDITLEKNTLCGEHGLTSCKIAVGTSEDAGISDGEVVREWAQSKESEGYVRDQDTHAAFGVWRCKDDSLYWVAVFGVPSGD